VFVLFILQLCAHFTGESGTFQLGDISVFSPYHYLVLNNTKITA